MNAAICTMEVAASVFGIAPSKNPPPKKGSLCGGTFAYSGYEAPLGPVNTFNGTITESPSQGGPQIGTLQETSVGQGAFFGVGYIQPVNSGSASLIDFSGFSFHTPFGGFSAGILGGAGITGVYFEHESGTTAAGTGVYLNTSLCGGS